MSAPPGSAAWFEGLLRDRLGPGASLGAITFEGRFLRIEGGRVPLGASGELLIARVEIELGAGLPLGGLPLAARLSALEGEVRAGGLVVPFQFTAASEGEPSWANGALRVGAPLDVEAAVSVLAREGGGFVVGITLATARSRVVIAGSLDAASGLHDARLTGRLATADLGWIGAPLPDAVVDLDLTAEGPLADPRLHGRVFAGEVQVARAQAPGHALRLADVSAEVDLDRRRLRFEHLVGSAGAARFGGWGRVALAPPSSEDAAVPLLALQIEHADGALLAEIAAVASSRVGLARGGAPGIPPDLAVTGELLVSAARAVSGSFAIETSRSALLFHLTVGAAGELLGSTLRGRVAAADAVTVGIFRGAVRPRSADVFSVDGRLAGTLARPGFSGRLGTTHTVIEVDPAADAVLEIDDGSVLLDLDGERVAWSRFEGRLHGGRFSSSGRWGRGGTLSAALEWSGVRVEEVPARAGVVGTVLRGASSGAVRFERESLAEHALRAHGTVALDEPVYLFLRSLAPALERYRLPILTERGEGPVRAAVRFESGAFVVERLSAALDGIEVEGAIRLDRDGRLVGRVAVTLLQEYLARSPILAIPAGLVGKVTLPVHVGGTARAPAFQTDAREILDGLIEGSRVREAVKSALDGLRPGARRPRKRR